MIPLRLRAPRENHTVLAEPPLDQAGDIFDRNRLLLDSPQAAFFGKSWRDWRQQARREALAAATAYFAETGEPIPTLYPESLIFAGHQPEFFHAGVWVKNFALNGLARRHAATPINLVVDNDAVKTTSLRLPLLGGSSSGPAAVTNLTALSFDAWTNEVPYEERRVQDEERFAQFLSRTSEITSSWNFKPLLTTFWPEVCRQEKRTPLLGERLAAARRALERTWGCANLELPVSSMCRTDTFAAFVWHILSQLPRFRGVYNACLQDYRRSYRIRSRHHPVPDLDVDGDWLEAPFWMWRSAAPERRRLWARPNNDSLELRFGGEEGATIRVGTIAELHDLHARGIKVRSRALTTTMFVRLFLADGFMHGIGGAKYDEVTDAISRRFFAADTPGYLVVSATLLLPFAPLHPSGEDCGHWARLLRDLDWNPQRHLPDGVAAAAVSLAEQKRHWLDMQPASPKQRRERFQALRRLTEQLRPFLRSQTKAAKQLGLDCTERGRAQAILQRRDYAFCLHPENLLRPFCTQFLAPSGGDS